MNRNITLILSAVLVVVLIGVWLWLVFFADRSEEPETIQETDEFANLGGLGDDAPGPGRGTGQSGNNTGGGGLFNADGEYDPDILRQLTTKRVVGYVETEIASTTHVLYMEAGVGHIYGINLENGEEERISATTIPNAREAAFSADGTRVLVKTGDSTNYNPVSLGTINFDEQSITLSPFAEGVGEFKFIADDVVLYTTQSNTSVIAQSKNLTTGAVSTVFTTPFREAVVELGDTTRGPHYFYPKTSYLLEGFVYEVVNGALYRTPLDGFGLTAERLGGQVFVSYRNQSTLVTESYNINTEEVTPLPTPLIPEKCVAASDEILCAVPHNHNLQYNSINRWLRGTLLLHDSLWQVGDATNEELINITEYSGRSVDVINGAIGAYSEDWYFQNKMDGSLWIYEVSEREENQSEAEPTIIEETI